jgi:hypothetical protein
MIDPYVLRLLIYRHFFYGSVFPVFLDVVASALLAWRWYFLVFGVSVAVVCGWLSGYPIL